MEIYEDFIINNNNRDSLNINNINTNFIYETKCK